ncbi:glycerol-3-phosphate acyltransferase 1, mitochondrial isoform X2 [Bacillus rossius redtenbacheri]
MVDAVSARIHEVYESWNPRGPPSDNNKMPCLTLNALKRYGHHYRQAKRLQQKDLLKQVQQHINLKETRWEDPFPPPKARPFTGLCCKTCTPSSRDFLADKVSRNLNVRNVLLVDAQNCRNGFLTRKFCYLATVWNLRKHDFPDVSATVLRDERLKQAIEAAVQEDMHEAKKTSDEDLIALRSYHSSRAQKILDRMRSKMSNFLLKLTSWVLYKLLPCFMSSVVAHPAHIRMLKEAGESNLPLVFVPLHRSHLDYILISFVLLINNIRPPLVAAGDNLRIPVFGWLLLGLGAFFIKRRMDPVQGRRDTVYRAVLHTYMMECLRAGHNMEFFIEGGRTRTGKTCMPKGGLLSIIVDAFLDGTIEDALLVPVSVNYERLVDGNFVREQLGQPKRMETFGSALKAIWSVLNSNHGIMRIDFNQPFSLRELVRSAGVARPQPSAGLPPPPPLPGGQQALVSRRNLHSAPSSASLYGTDVVAEDQRQLVDGIARHIVYDCTRAQAVMSTNAVAFLLLSRFRGGATLGRLAAALDELRKELDWGGRDTGFTGESLDVVNHAVELLGPGLVRRERPVDGATATVTITPVTMLPNVIELSYYSNAVTSHYVIDSVLATALYPTLRDALGGIAETGGRRVAVSHDSLLALCHELFDVLQFEFVFCKPCQELGSLVAEAIDGLRAKEILCLPEQEYLTEQEQWSQRYARNLEEECCSSDESEAGFKMPEYNVVMDGEAAAHLEFLHRVLRPLVDAYVVAGLALGRLVGRELAERDLLLDVLAEMKTQLDAGFISCGESMCVDPVRNALKLFECWGVLQCHSHGGVKLYYLHRDYDSDERVAQVFRKLGRFKHAARRAL